jgi:hypothetical protein
VRSYAFSDSHQLPSNGLSGQLHRVTPKKYRSAPASRIVVNGVSFMMRRLSWVGVQESVQVRRSMITHRVWRMAMSGVLQSGERISESSNSAFSYSGCVGILAE